MKKITTTAFFLLLSVLCVAQSFDQLESSFFNDKQGLSNNSVRCFYQDKKGFLWIGTEDGLNRYDGTSIKVYRQQHGSKNSLPGNNIFSIVGDDSTGLWVLTSEGVVLFFSDNENAIDYTNALCEGKKQSIAGSLGKLFYDAHHTLCLINDFGISFFDKQQNIFQMHKIFLPQNPSQLTRITDYFQEDSNTLLLLGYYGVIRYNTTTHEYHYIEATLNYFKNQPSIPLIEFLKNDDGKLWITTSCYGLIIIDEKNNSAKSFLIDKGTDNKNLRNLMTFIEKPASGVFKNEILIGNQGYGVFVVKPDEQSDFSGFEKIDNSSNISNKEKNQTLLSSYCNYTDKNNISYIGTANGVFSSDPSDQVFRKYKNQFEGGVSSIIKRKTTSGSSQYYFSAVYNGGLHIYDSHLRKLKTFRNVPPDDKVPGSSSINSLYVDHKDQLWICTYKGLHIYDESKDKFKSFLPDKLNPNSIRHDRITTIFQDHNGIYWIGFFVRGFQCYDSEKNIFYDLNLKTPCRDNAYVFNIIEDTDNNIWLTRDQGIVKINSTRTAYEEYFTKANDSAGISNESVECLFLDSKKRLWLGTKNGLNLYQPQTNSFKKYFREDGLQSDHIYCLGEDKNGNIWMGTTNALNILNPATGKIIFYNSISTAVIFSDEDGEMIIGSGGPPVNFVTCHANAIKLDERSPLPYITNLKITGDNQQVKNVCIENSNTIKLNYRENYLTFDFTGVSYNKAYLNQFKCKLEGLETKWNETGKVRSINYAALEPGEYDFKVMCCNSDGIWNPKTASLHISILPPFWQSDWFKFLMIVFFASIAYFIYQQRIKKVRNEESIKTKLAQLETQALMAQMNPHFIFNALNSIQACIVSNNNDAAYSYLNKFSMLVRSILQNSREQFILLSSELEILKNYLELEQLRFKDLDFNIRLDGGINANRLKVPSTFLQPFVENAIIHGLPHKREKKQLEILISSTGSALIFKIRDNGIGRKKSGEINQNRTRSHTSIGMSLIASRLKLINEQYGVTAEITIVDLYDSENRAAGTEVNLILPLALQEEIF